jgi:hypothetical protein
MKAIGAAPTASSGQRHLGNGARAIASSAIVPEPATSKLVIVSAVAIYRIGGRMRQEFVSA